MIGSNVARVEDPSLLRGEASFVADLIDAGTLHVGFLRSPVAAGRIVRLDLDGALRSPGVIAAIDGDTLSRFAGALPVLHTPDPTFVEATGFGMSVPSVYGLARDRVRFVGEPVAAVVAESRALAEDALERIDLVIDEEEPVVDPRAALDPQSRQVHPETPGNKAAWIRFARGDVTQRGIVVEGRYRIGRHSGVPLECRGVLGAYDARDDRVHLWTSTQIPFLVRRAVCEALGWSEERLRVAVPEVGGGFGPKANIYHEELVVAFLSRRLRARVAWIEDRTEHLLSSAQSRDQFHRTRLTVDGEGRILAYEDEFLVDIGSHNLWVAGVVANTAIHGHGPYRIPAFDIRGTAVVTNKAPTSQYRGAGRPEACFALERTLDLAAARLGIDPIEVRRRNVLTSSDLPYAVGLPYRDGKPIVFDGHDFGATLETAVRLVTESRKRVDENDAGSEDSNPTGVGYAMFIEATGRGPYETARVRLGADGRIWVHSGAASAGQSHKTTLAQIVAEVLSVDLVDVRVVSGDTDLAPDGIGTFASRTAAVAGPAVHRAAEELAKEIRGRAARLLDCRPEDVTFVDGELRDAPGDRKISWVDLAEAHLRGGVLSTLPFPDVVERFEPDTVTWVAGTHAAVVEVDADIGRTRVVDYVVVDEGGRAIHPRVVEDQIRGGVAQGIGGVLLEEFEFDSNGQPKSVTLAEYLLPTSLDVPDIQVHHITSSSPLNRLGVKGVGESGTIPVYAAVASAVDAAFQWSIHMDATPISPPSLLAALENES